MDVHILALQAGVQIARTQSIKFALRATSLPATADRCHYPGHIDVHSARVCGSQAGAVRGQGACILSLLSDLGLIGGPLCILECRSDLYWRRALHRTLHWLHALREVRAREDVPFRAEV